ncbi:MAG: cobalt ECF transporter T component CbiQ [Elusimicrobia bacterium RIFOXYA2_FULL_58_8]|nr:MAG: cobalt ECF transporter T component CbiQ [Elusimicrobia bacterium RIFOXYA2_FULL_58_8]
MQTISTQIFDIGYMDTLAGGDTALHRLDARAKLLVTALFIVCVVSFNHYEISRLMPFFLYPVFLIAAGELPAGYLLRKVLAVAPFAVFVGMFNPLLDRGTLFQLGPLAVSGGAASFFSILLRFLLTVTTALALVALTGVNGICAALESCGVPKVFVMQLLFLNRYITVLAGEAGRMARARALRSFSAGEMPAAVFARLAGQLLLRAYARAERIYSAMLCRGFYGRIQLQRSSTVGGKEIAFVATWAAVFTLFRLVDIPQFFGNFLTGL